ncbi:hypothetical protein CAPTEDRAFT_89558 [Capitella teleta]|uniref:Ketoreductase domain-containing protein n=1 Tax=Capitella teleta TaxID=283909 RepID=R7UFX7_CAPTE|nr:hypothetical protein CAPTEDRAFT_89558 [Capitella teleta]|eukprot:ELU02192.1 hypothetical protein CAPTEDRAFT_89558 [Capitella teleta]
MASLAGKVALITGASSGIGAATALHFAKLGARLALTGRNSSKLEEVADQCVQLTNRKPFTVTGDVAQESNVENVYRSTIDHFNKLDVLINNAGIIGLGSIEETSLAQYDKIMAINMRSLYQLIMLATPKLIETKGSIVNLSSITGIRAFSGILAYCISKASVDQLTKSVALALAPKGVRCNAVNPGVIVTELQKRGGLNDEQYRQFLENCKVSHAMGRPGQPEEVAKAIAFLASDHSSFITGVSLPIDGGRHAMCPR